MTVGIKKGQAGRLLSGLESCQTKRTSSDKPNVHFSFFGCLSRNVLFLRRVRSYVGVSEGVVKGV